MSNFKVGDQITIMPHRIKGYIKTIDLSATYPISAYCSTPPNNYEGSYLLDGFRYKNSVSDISRKYYITKDVVASTQTTQPTTKTSPYWSIVKVNSLFIHLVHTGLGGCIIPISNIDRIYYNNVSVILSANASNYDLGPIQFDEVANLLFAQQQQSNSI